MKKLYIGNLSYDIDKDKLAEIFSAFGEVLSAVVITDRETGRSKGFGFVELDDDAAQKAIDEMDGKEVDGRNIKVNEARPMNNDRRPSY